MTFLQLSILQWLRSNEVLLVAVSLLSVLLLLFVNVSVVEISSITSIPDSSTIPKFMIALTLVLTAIIPLPIIHKGIVPIAIAGIGLPLISAGTVIPITTSSSLSMSENPEGIVFIAEGYFLLGVSMMSFSFVSAYKPSLLYVKNRPEDAGDVNQEEFPLWDKMDRGANHAVSIGRFDDEANVPLKDLMSEIEKYLIWRYSYVLVSIHGIRYLAIPNSYVPYSSIILRDKNGRIIGKGKYSSVWR
ncbi:MAG TPA: hypothetical protein VE504_04250 [Nitrososphaeraceae archaeon]|jgi:hypothetical protein|nr:hypothetical protein [Nitrososphaeraceae archaeon]